MSLPLVAQLMILLHSFNDHKSCTVSSGRCLVGLMTFSSLLILCQHLLSDCRTSFDRLIRCSIGSCPRVLVAGWYFEVLPAPPHMHGACFMVEVGSLVLFHYGKLQALAPCSGAGLESTTIAYLTIGSRIFAYFMLGEQDNRLLHPWRHVNRLLQALGRAACLFQLLPQLLQGRVVVFVFVF